MEGYDRITHHVAFFRFQSPKRCLLQKEESGGHGDNDSLSVVKIECGAQDDRNNTMVWEEFGRGAYCDPPRNGEGEVICYPNPAALPNSTVVVVAFTCGTYQKDYISNSSSTRPPTASIQIDNTEALCDSVSNNDNNTEVPLEIAASVGRLCGDDSLGAETPWYTHMSTNECNEQNDGVGDAPLQVHEFPEFPIGGVACYRSTEACTPASDSEQYCKVAFSSFSLKEDFNLPECQSDGFDQETQLDRIFEMALQQIDRELEGVELGGR